MEATILGLYIRLQDLSRSKLLVSRLITPIIVPYMPQLRRLDYSSYELLSKLLVSPLITPIVVPYIIPYITPFEEIRL